MHHEYDFFWKSGSTIDSLHWGLLYIGMSAVGNLLQKMYIINMRIMFVSLHQEMFYQFIICVSSVGSLPWVMYKCIIGIITNGSLHWGIYYKCIIGLWIFSALYFFPIFCWNFQMHFKYSFIILELVKSIIVFINLMSIG